MEIADIFVPVDCNDIKGPIEFPLDLLVDKVLDIKSYTVAQEVLFTSVNTIIQPGKIEDCALIVPVTLTKEKAYHYAAKTLLAAGVDRNKMVYDTENKGISARLLALLRFVNRQTSRYITKKITDVFIKKEEKLSETFLHTAKLFSITIHQIDMTENLRYYKEALHATFPKDCTNLVIAVDRTADAFVMPFRGQSWGVAVLDNTKVLLGAY